MPRPMATRSLHRFLAPAALAVALVAGACGDDHDDHDHDHQSPAACKEISNACHAHDDGTPGPIHECHELGHGTNAEACAARRDECLALCSADGGHEGGGH